LLDYTRRLRAIATLGVRTVATLLLLIGVTLVSESVLTTFFFRTPIPSGWMVHAFGVTREALRFLIAAGVLLIVQAPLIA
jgi:hypothetical protein